MYLIPSLVRVGVAMGARRAVKRLIWIFMSSEHLPYWSPCETIEMSLKVNSEKSIRSKLLSNFQRSYSICFIFPMQCFRNSKCFLNSAEFLFVLSGISLRSARVTTIIFVICGSGVRLAGGQIDLQREPISWQLKSNAPPGEGRRGACSRPRCRIVCLKVNSEKSLQSKLLSNFQLSYSVCFRILACVEWNLFPFRSDHWHHSCDFWQRSLAGWRPE